MFGVVEETKDQSILPEISNTFANIKNQLLSGFMPDYDATRLALQENKTGLYCIYIHIEV